MLEQCNNYYGTDGIEQYIWLIKLNYNKKSYENFKIFNTERIIQVIEDKELKLTSSHYTDRNFENIKIEFDNETVLQDNTFSHDQRSTIISQSRLTFGDFEGGMLKKRANTITEDTMHAIK